VSDLLDLITPALAHTKEQSFGFSFPSKTSILSDKFFVKKFLNENLKIVPLNPMGGLSGLQGWVKWNLVITMW